jgi:hypothetical protein
MIRVTGRDVVVELPSGAVPLREATAGEWGEILEAYRVAAEKVDASEGSRSTALYASPPPFCEAFALVLATLSDLAAPDPAKLPMWCAREGTIGALWRAWGEVPFEEGPVAAPIDGDDDWRPIPGAGDDQGVGA